MNTSYWFQMNKLALLERFFLSKILSQGRIRCVPTIEHWLRADRLKLTCRSDYLEFSAFVYSDDISFDWFSLKVFNMFFKKKPQNKTNCKQKNIYALLDNVRAH